LREVMERYMGKLQCAMGVQDACVWQRLQYLRMVFRVELQCAMGGLWLDRGCARSRRSISGCRAGYKACGKSWSVTCVSCRLCYRLGGRRVRARVRARKMERRARSEAAAAAAALAASHQASHA
jgi:hypothetical protein